MEVLRRLRDDPNLESVKSEEVTEKKEFGDVLFLLQSSEDKILIIDGDSEKFLGYMMDMVEEEQYCKFFFTDEIARCPIGHELVPEHRLITSEELEELGKRKIPLSSLPRLSMKDIISRWYGWDEGTIIAIDRRDGPYYRVVARN
jgi:DNA-directed RNA polymerase subunit H (RpoH/RPB5)